MPEQEDYKAVNRSLWNTQTDVHIHSAMYDVAGFLQGRSTLKPIELGLLGNLSGQSVLHLQCHFGMDTLSLLGAGAQHVTGIDLADQAIAKANELAQQLHLADRANFVCTDLYSLPDHLAGQFDVVFTSYGVISWLPDLARWAQVVKHFLKPGGRFVMVEFHPVLWLLDDDDQSIRYPYFNKGVIELDEEVSYADRETKFQERSHNWNHSLADVIGNLLDQGLTMSHFQEYDYSPYNCFTNMIEPAPGQFQFKKYPGIIPMLFSLVAEG